jgi:hypothetical protein
VAVHCTLEIVPESRTSGSYRSLGLVPTNASGDRTDQLPDTRRLYRNGVVGSTGPRIPTHSRRPITFHRCLPAHGAPSTCITHFYDREIAGAHQDIDQLRWTWPSLNESCTPTPELSSVYQSWGLRFCAGYCGGLVAPLESSRTEISTPPHLTA